MSKMGDLFRKWMADPEFKAAYDETADKYAPDGDFPPFVEGSDTSEAAAESVAPLTASMREAVFTYIQSAHKRGRTCDEVENALGMRHQTASARVRELVRAGRLVDSGARTKTRSGRSATLWVAV